MPARRNPTPLVRGSAMVRSGAVLARSVVLGLCLLAQPATAAVSPNGSQFQVNTHTTRLQSFPSVAMDASGKFVVVWASQYNAGGDTSPWSVQAQRYDSTGAPIGGEFQVNTYTTSSQINPSVASDPAGNFIVVWNSAGSSGSDTSGFSIQGQRFDASGSPIGGEFQVNSYTTGYQKYPAVARNSSGNFVVVWESPGSAGSDSSGRSVHGQPYDASGAPIGGEFQVNTYTTNSQINPSVASDSAGNFVVVWQSNGSVDSSNVSVQGQRYDASGSPIGTQFGISTDATAHQSFPSVASDPSGNFVVAWHSHTSPGYITAEVRARAYEASGSAIGAQFQVNTYTTSSQVSPSVASDSQGDFVVAWQSWGSAGSDNSWYSIQGQRYLPEPSFVSGLGAMLALLVALVRRRNGRTLYACASRRGSTRSPRPTRLRR
jgi:hypothetical protein